MKTRLTILVLFTMVVFTGSVSAQFLGGNGSGYSSVTRAEGALPVELTSFSASIDGQNVLLNWSTATEKNNYGFDIERSYKNSSNWEQIGFVKGSGNSNVINTYSFTDLLNTEGTYYYRLKQIDNDGKFEYLKGININFTTPLEYSLNQNYPNPFNPGTKISFSLPEESRVVLSIYNLLGQKVSVLVDGLIERGRHNILFDGSELNSGIYFYKLETSDFFEVKKMQLIK